jgi:nitrogen fixation protein
MANKKINQLDVRTSPSLTDLLAIADPSSGYAYKITGTSLQSLLDVTNRVPYTGATASVNLGEFGLTAGQLTLDTSPTGTAVVGTTQWNDTIGSSQTLLKGGNVLLKNGVDLVARVVNKVSPATTLTKAAYKAVRVSGAQGQRLAIAYAQANNDNNSADTIGLVCETIAANQEGFIITVGQLENINTTGSLQGETWADGDVLYLSPTTAGSLTNIKPTGATGHIVIIGYVEYAHQNNGKIYVKIMNGWELDELHNVYINTPANNEVLTYESSTSLWKNKSIATALGYTPANDSLVMHLAGTETATGVKTFSIGLATTTGDNFMNTSSGNLLVGYAATPGSNVYKINVNGNAKFNQLYVNDGTQYSLTFNAGTSNGQLLLSGSYPSVVLKTSTGDNRVFISNDGPNAKIQMWYGTTSSIYLDTNADGYYSLGLAIGKTSAPVTTAILELTSVSRGLLLPRMTTAQKNAISTPATSLLLYDTDLATFQYYSGSAWASLGGGGGISGSGIAGQVTYWSGTSAVTGSSNLFWDNTNGRLGIGTSSPTAGIQINGANDLLYLNGAGARTTLKLGALTSGYTEVVGNGTNFYFTTTTTTNISFITNNVDRFRLFGSTGNVLIQNGGTFTDSNYRLDINGTGATAGALRVTGGNVQFGSSTGLNWDNTNSRLGIGTSSPTAKLSVIDNINGSNTFYFLNNSTGTSARSLFLIGEAASGGTYGTLQYINSGYTTSGLVTPNTILLTSNATGGLTLAALDASGTIKFASANATSPMMTLTATGSLKFNSPSGSNNTYIEGYNSSGTLVAKLSEASTVGSGGLYFQGARADATSGGAMLFAGYVGSSGNTSAIEFRAVGGTIASISDLPSGIPIAIFSKRSGAATVNQMMLFQTGNLLIQNGGTFTDNGYRLDVQGTFRATGQVRLSGLPTSATGLSAGDLWNNSGVINIV